MTILNSESAARVGPLHIVENVTDDSAGSALDAAFIREEHPSIFLWSITIRWTAIDALLPLTVQANITIDDPDMCSSTIHVVHVE